MKNALNPRIIDIISSYEGDASILALNLGVLANLLNCCLYTFVAHFKGVLDHEGVDDALPELLLLKRRGRSSQEKLKSLKDPQTMIYLL
jgi:hypothetical protein